MNCKKNAKSRSDDGHLLFDPAVEKVVELGLERLRPFENHPFKVKEDEAMARLMESIERYGIMNPLIVMPTTEGFYRIISGHRRKYCAEKLGYAGAGDYSVHERGRFDHIYGGFESSQGKDSVQ